MGKAYQLEKNIFTEADFEQMGWHDALIHAVSFGSNDELSLDIDYIFQWVHPQGTETFFKFWIAPCTLVFENVYNLKFNLEVSVPSELSIGDITRSNLQLIQNRELNIYDWMIESVDGDITFKATGYKQYVRAVPQLTEVQELGLGARGGVSFGTSFSPQC